jgi:hypothetical protein
MWATLAISSSSEKPGREIERIRGFYSTEEDTVCVS